MSTNPQINKIQEEIKKTLEEKGCVDIAFSNPNENLLIVTFNCKELTSFKYAIEGWTYSGIQLDPTKQRQYKIEFMKTTTSNYNLSSSSAVAGTRS